MKKYSIEIEEILQKVCEIEADSLEDALIIAENKYDNGEIVLGYEDIKNKSIKEYKEKQKNYDRER